MPTLLIKNISEELLKELKKLKIDLGCRTWAELLEKLVRTRPREVVVIDEGDCERMEKGVDEFLKLREVVSSRWSEGTVLEEFKRSRKHEAD